MLDPLASTDDYETFTGQEADARVAMLLDMASATVRRYTGQTLSLVEDDVVTVRPRNGVARLPQRPVTEVSEVVRNGVTLDASTYSWTRQGLLYGPDNFNRFDLDLVWGCVPLTVTYSHGFAEVPSDIIGVVLGLVGRAVGNTSDIRQESIGSYSVTYGSSSSSMLQPELAVLDSYRMPVGAIDTYPSWA